MTDQQMTEQSNAILHLRKDGETKYEELSKLHNISTASTDAEIKNEVERHFDLGQGALNDFVVERHGNDISVRPAANYG